MTVVDLQDLADEAPAYHQGYIRLVEGADPLALLARELDEADAELVARAADRGDYAYAAGKWTLKEVLLHMVDVERIFSYRALRIARGDAQPLPGFEQDDYVPESGAGHRTLEDILAEFRSVRAATLTLFRSFPAPVLARRGTVSGQPYTVRAIAAILAGHARHHMAIIRERYL